MNSTVPGISNALSQMRTMAAEADGRGMAQGVSGGAGSGFGRMGGVGGSGGIGGIGGIGEAGGTRGTDAAGGADGNNFADMLKASLAKVSQTQNHSITEAHAFETGSSDTSLSDVMIDMQKANIQFQTAVQVRNKLVSAYNDIMQMQV